MSKQSRTYRFFNMAQDAEGEWKHSNKASTRAMRLRQLKNVCKKLNIDSGAEVLVLVKIPNTRVSTKRAMTFGEDTLAFMSSDIGQTFYRSFMEFKKESFTEDDATEGISHELQPYPGASPKSQKEEILPGPVSIGVSTPTSSPVPETSSAQPTTGVPPSKRRSLLSEEEILLMKSKGFVSLS